MMFGPVCIQFFLNETNQAWVVSKLIPQRLYCNICFLINPRMHLPLACSDHLLPQFSANPAVTNLCRLISYDCDLLKLTLGPTTSPTARSCQACAVKEELFSSPLTYLLLESHLYFFVPGQQAGRLAAALLEVPARLGGWSQSWAWFHCGWGLLSGKASVLEDLQTACPAGIRSLSAMTSCYVTHLLTFS